MSAGIIQARANLEAYLPELRKAIGLSPLAGELEQALSKDQIDLSLTIRNSHACTLNDADLKTWARIADRLELARDLMAARHEGEIAAACATIDDRIVRACYLERVPVFQQGGPDHEVLEDVTADDCTAWVASLERLDCSRRRWRIAACMFGFAWALAAVAVFW